MNPFELPHPDDTELETLYERELYRHCWTAAQRAVQEYPETAARVIAEVWMQSAMLDALKGTMG